MQSIRIIILLSLVVGSIVARRCPVGYTLYRNGDCVRIAVVNENRRIDEMTEKAMVECQKDDAYPPIIHSKEDEFALSNVFYSGIGSFDFILGAVCDSKTKQFRWADGSSLDYVISIQADMNCAGTPYLYSFANGQNVTEGPKWFARAPDFTVLYTIVCIKSFQSHMDATCFDFEKFISTADNRTSCYQVSSTSSDWSSAQSQCHDNFASLVSIHSREENDFVKKLSVSKGYHTGVHIGANLSGKESNKFGWTDGSQMDYDNFYDGFPIDGLGGCTAMDLSSGKWMNDECSTKLPFVCKREPEAVTPACSSRLYSPGEIITPPGYPMSASEPCDYFLKVDPGKIVELEILFLEANACCDHLLIYNGQFDSEPFANLTGADREGEIFRTTSTVNIMRVSWQPKGAVNVRGFEMTFRAV